MVVIASAKSSRGNFDEKSTVNFDNLKKWFETREIGGKKILYNNLAKHFIHCTSFQECEVVAHRFFKVFAQGPHSIVAKDGRALLPNPLHKANT